MASDSIWNCYKCGARDVEYTHFERCNPVSQLLEAAKMARAELIACSKAFDYIAISIGSLESAIAKVEGQLVRDADGEN